MGRAERALCQNAVGPTLEAAMLRAGLEVRGYGMSRVGQQGCSRDRSDAQRPHSVAPPA